MGEVFIEKHVHQKAQFLYTEGGLVYVKNETEEFYLPARHFMWIPPGVEHAIYPSSPKVVMRNLYFPVHESDHPFYFTQGIYPANDMLMQLLLFTEKWNGNICPTEKDKFPIVEAFKVLLPQISNRPILLNLPLANDERLKRVTNLLRKDLSKNWTLTDIAKQFLVSERTLHRLFKKDMSISFIRYYTLLRIFTAIEYIIEGRYTIAEIALMVGYSSLPSFSNTFTKIVGKRPTEYYKSNYISTMSKA
ncbi:transcriptional regulator, AraC family [Mesonia phycicola]|uniref:Transcriptional regulator, AraC family n=2 Tax=Mesonia phycicola TaxID=579105 RepID=A0A1M6AA47_9FLAO|nr:transcriptional regulator, AraC family [Mesonia phycicola]